MNHGTKVTVTAQPNGDLTLENDDGTITIRQDGAIVLSTLAPIELTGESLGKLDGSDVINIPMRRDGGELFLRRLLLRGKRA